MLTRSLLFLLAPLAACGGGEAPATEASAPPATAVAATPAPAVGCQWLTSEAASEALGADVTVTVAAGWTNTCEIASDPQTVFGRFNVDEGWTLDNSLNAYENTAGWGAREAITGLGERAAWVSHETPDGTVKGMRLGVEQGGSGVTVMLTLTPAQASADARAKVEALGQAILENV
ncbi:MAG TPA: hypothetical protein VF576_10325 [Rubricoccaceae bacterium]|jgi:hypothetical protein